MHAEMGDGRAGPSLRAGVGGRRRLLGGGSRIRAADRRLGGDLGGLGHSVDTGLEVEGGAGRGGKMEPQPPSLGAADRVCCLPKADRLGCWHWCPPCPPTTEEGVPGEGLALSLRPCCGGDEKTDWREGPPSWWGPSGLHPAVPGASTIWGHVLTPCSLCPSSRGLSCLL